ncbi:MAG: hypothetical protein JWN72_2436 [Thermoleophilia bacterium]|nr:hypothetical protein [Thermoleophilia bacterium]
MSLVSPAAAPLLTAGAVVVGGLLGYAATRTDGSQYISHDYGPDVVITPRSQDAARSSLVRQRVFGGITIAAGAALSLASVLRPGLGTRTAIAGAGMAAFGIGKLIKLDGAEAKLSKALPEHTPIGTPSYDRDYRGWGSYHSGFGGLGSSYSGSYAYSALADW